MNDERKDENIELPPHNEPHNLESYVRALGKATLKRRYHLREADEASKEIQEIQEEIRVRTKSALTLSEKEAHLLNYMDEIDKMARENAPAKAPPEPEGLSEASLRRIPRASIPPYDD